MPEKHDLIEAVRRMAAAGRTEPEIIGHLRALGFRPAEIDHALKSVLKERVEERKPAVVHQPQPIRQPQPVHQAPHVQPAHEHAQAFHPHESGEQTPSELVTEKRPPRNELPETTAIPEFLRPIEIPGLTPKHHEEKHEEQRPTGPTEQINPLPHTPQRGGGIEVEELVEEVVEENMRKLQERLGAIDSRDAQLESELEETRKMMSEAKNIDVKLQKAFENHNDEMKEFMAKFESRIAALEHAFKSISAHVKK